uniref:Uncharacterized protein n=1 Tax=viral metagenome TaxID=1070528 RepID=A0A6C0M220_9ZZZZ
MSTDPLSRAPSARTPAGSAVNAVRHLTSPPEIGTGNSDPSASPIARHSEPGLPEPQSASPPRGPSGPVDARRTPSFGTGAFKKPPPVPKGGRRLSQTRRFCKCIKDVRKTVKARRGSTKEKGAIAICVKGVLQKKGRTLKKFKCGRKARVLTQRRLR